MFEFLKRLVRKPLDPNQIKHDEGQRYKKRWYNPLTWF